MFILQGFVIGLLPVPFYLSLKNKLFERLRFASDLRLLQIVFHASAVLKNHYDSKFFEKLPATVGCSHRVLSIGLIKVRTD